MNFAEISNYEFLRNPTADGHLLGLSLMVDEIPQNTPITEIAMGYSSHYFNKAKGIGNYHEAKYVNAAIAGRDYLLNCFELGGLNEDSYQQYKEMTKYAEDDIDRNYSVHMVTIPWAISVGMDNIRRYLGGDSRFSNPEIIDSVIQHTASVDLLESYGQSMHEAKTGKSFSLHYKNAGQFLFLGADRLDLPIFRRLVLKSINQSVVLDNLSAVVPAIEQLQLGNWLFERTRGNFSRQIGIFNSLLKFKGLKPVSPGVLDFAAYYLDHTEFSSYMLRVIGKYNPAYKDDLLSLENMESKGLEPSLPAMP